MSLSPTLGRNEKVEQYIRKKTHKSNALRFWIEGSVISFGLVLIVWNILDVFALGFVWYLIRIIEGLFLEFIIFYTSRYLLNLLLAQSQFECLDQIMWWVNKRQHYKSRTISVEFIR